MAITLLEQLKFLFDCRQDNSKLIVDHNKITLTVPKVSNARVVGKLASRKGVVCIFDPKCGTTAHLHLAATLKDDGVILPNSPTQNSLINLIEGNENYIGLRELFTFITDDATHGMQFRASRMESMYVSEMGWDGVQRWGGPDIREVMHPLWQEWIKTLDNNQLYRPQGVWRCFRDYKRRWLVPVNEVGDKCRFMQDGRGSSNFMSGIGQLSRISFHFENGAKISFASKDNESPTVQIQEPTWFSQYEEMLTTLTRGKDVTALAESNTLQQYLDLGLETETV